MEVPSYGVYADLDWPEPQKGHAAMITRMDGDVGKLLDLLKELEIDERTVVLFTSDNGPHREGGNQPDFNDSNGPLRGIKRDLFEGGIRVPLIARWPGKIAPNTTTEHPSAFWDFLPTACQIAGIDPPSDIDGISYLPAMLGKEQPKHEYLYWEFKRKRAVRFGPWKAIYRHPETVELYHLENDLDESDDVSDNHPELVTKAKELMQKAHTDSEKFPIPEIP
jgi:uncharacterized sulfatase